MRKRAYLVLEDGTSYEGLAFGAATRGSGEVVFSTSMTGYQEALTDPSYAGQILLMTFPLIGNYGINLQDVESKRVQVSGFAVREATMLPSHRLSMGTIHDYLLAAGVPGIAEIDTRAITRKLRTAGVMMGMITSSDTVEEALARLREIPRYGGTDLVPAVSVDSPFVFNEAPAGPGPHIVVVDLGVKYNIMRCLQRLGAHVTSVPCESTAEDILALRPDGIVISPGPGDPSLLDYAVETCRGVAGRVPLFGICLGHQVIGRAFGAGTYKLKFGHRGANHPVKDLATGSVHITSQNHGYAVDPVGLSSRIEVSHINVNDGTVEGLSGKDLPLMTIQYHSEASPGPHDNMYLFERFLAMVAKAKGR
jgi:carbamoyl-phosphate synthase small subunit